MNIEHGMKPITVNRVWFYMLGLLCMLIFPYKNNDIRTRIWAFILFISVLILFCSQAKAKTFTNLPAENDSKVYVFFDQNHSFVKKNDSFVSTNYITTGFNLTNEFSIKILGSERFCKNIFYFSENKIIFYNPSQEMTSSGWCEVQITNKKIQKTIHYKFILNKTFSAWCQEKDTNLSIGKTVKAILNIFESNVCNDNFSPILAKARVLNLSNSHLDDVSPIAGFLQVRSLWLDNNEIETIDALGSMHNLVFLSLNNNYVSNAKSLGEMQALQWVFLNNNQIINIDFIHNLKTLKFLGINGNLVGDPTPLYGVSPSTYILANGNPFIKHLCKKYNRSLSKDSYLFKNCLENTTIKSTMSHNVQFLSMPEPSHKHKL